METRRVIVPVATVWTSKKAPRDVDELALKGRTKEWVSQLSDKQTIDLCDAKRVETQAFFNDEVIVSHTEGPWSKVYLTSQQDDADPRGYIGWIPTALLSDGPVSYPTTARIRIVSPFTTLYDQDKHPIFEITMGTELTEIAVENDWLKVATPFGENYVSKESILVTASGESAGDKMVALGRQFLGLRYLWGGVSPIGFDCSGFVYTLHRVLGFDIPRDADDQRQGGQPVAPEDLRAGDLMFFAYEHGSGYVHHVGMYIGNGQMIQSRTPGKQVDIAQLTEMRYAPEFVAARRYWR